SWCLRVRWQSPACGPVTQNLGHAHNELSRVDHVLLSEKTKDLTAAQNVFVVQGRPDDPAMLRAHMPTVEAAQRPVQESFSQLESVNQRLEQDRAREQSLEQQRSQEQQQRGPTPSL
ncbi:XVIPCD domain-containing protein, partial [Xanthomonas phaseoli]|uniref:XVIPCD domain-containing protein n=4 Tax=Xanthomonas phaseoli TaxID=1985254 RepID=UPI0031B576FC